MPRHTSPQPFNVCDLCTVQLQQGPVLRSLSVWPELHEGSAKHGMQVQCIPWPAVVFGLFFGGWALSSDWFLQQCPSKIHVHLGAVGVTLAGTAVRGCNKMRSHRIRVGPKFSPSLQVRSDRDTGRYRPTGQCHGHEGQRRDSTSTAQGTPTSSPVPWLRDSFKVSDRCVQSSPQSRGHGTLRGSPLQASG